MPSSAAEALPILDNLVSANADRAEDPMEPGSGLVFVVFAALALAALVVAQVWLARRFRRTLNRRHARRRGAAAGCCGRRTLGPAAQPVTRRSARIRSGSFAAVNAAAAARIKASNAKSNEA